MYRIEWIFYSDQSLCIYLLREEREETIRMCLSRSTLDVVLKQIVFLF